jgi:hypothetical protein
MIPFGAVWAYLSGIAAVETASGKIAPGPESRRPFQADFSIWCEKTTFRE